MERDEYVQRRKARYMAQVLEAFERDIEPHLVGAPPDAVERFKRKVRSGMNSLAYDAVDGADLMVQNGVALDLRQPSQERA